jgi:O-6-methylguanine DNA methyltransferase
MYITYYHSPIGLLQIKGNADFIEEIGYIENETETAIWQLGEEAKKQFESYFAGKLTDFDLPLCSKGTGFQQKVWQALCEIPFGETRSYGEIATRIGNPKAARAVGMANNRNPISIVVPCHRVVGADKKLVGYAGGLWRKEFLLDLERKQKLF